MYICIYVWILVNVQQCISSFPWLFRGCQLSIYGSMGLPVDLIQAYALRFAGRTQSSRALLLAGVLPGPSMHAPTDVFSWMPAAVNLLIVRPGNFTRGKARISEGSASCQPSRLYCRWEISRVISIHLMYLHVSNVHVALQEGLLEPPRCDASGKRFDATTDDARRWGFLTFGRLPIFLKLARVW